MLQKLLDFFTKPSLMKEAEKNIIEMLNISYDMFHYAMSIVIEKEKEREDIYKIDRKLNKLQRRIRKEVLEHLAINPAQDIIPSLILTTIVIDIERIGDFSKNLIELSHMYPKQLKGKYIKKIRKIEENVQLNFKKVINVYKEQNKETGSNLMSELVLTSSECQKLLEEIIEDKNLKSKEGIIYALLLRYLKRVSSHIKNVASSVINPFHRLGYRPKNKSKIRG